MCDRIETYLFTPDKVTLTVEHDSTLLEAEHDVTDQFVKYGRRDRPTWRLRNRRAAAMQLPSDKS